MDRLFFFAVWIAGFFSVMPTYGQEVIVESVDGKGQVNQIPILGKPEWINLPRNPVEENFAHGPCLQVEIPTPDWAEGRELYSENEKGANVKLLVDEKRIQVCLKQPLARLALRKSQAARSVGQSLVFVVKNPEPKVVIDSSCNHQDLTLSYDINRYFFSVSVHCFWQKTKTGEVPLVYFKTSEISDRKGAFQLNDGSYIQKNFSARIPPKQSIDIKLLNEYLEPLIDFHFLLNQKPKEEAKPTPTPYPIPKEPAPHRVSFGGTSLSHSMDYADPSNSFDLSQSGLWLNYRYQGKVLGTFLNRTEIEVIPFLTSGGTYDIKEGTVTIATEQREKIMPFRISSDVFFTIRNQGRSRFYLGIGPQFAGMIGAETYGVVFWSSFAFTMAFQRSIPIQPWEVSATVAPIGRTLSDFTKSYEIRVQLSYPITMMYGMPLSLFGQYQMMSVPSGTNSFDYNYSLTSYRLGVSVGF